MIGGFAMVALLMVAAIGLLALKSTHAGHRRQAALTRRKSSTA